MLAVLAAAATAHAAEPTARKAPVAPAAATAAPPPAGTPTPSPDAPALPPSGDTAAPATPQDAEMQGHRALGHRLYRLGRYEEAAEAFRRAYEIKADARLLFNIAECYRELDAVDQALFYYDRYLAGWPDAFDRAEVEEKVAVLESKRGGTAPRTTVARRRHPLMIVEPPPSKPRQQPRAWQRWWFWTIIGAGVAGGITAAALSSGSEPGVPMTELGNKRFD